MIQLATDPTASRMSWRPAANDGKSTRDEAPLVRSGHPWPFLSRYAARPSHHEGRKSAADAAGS
jgi:hypothetical protein